MKDPKEVILNPDTTTVAQACDEYDRSKGEKVVYFANLPKLVREVNALNQATTEKAKRVAEEYTRIAVMESRINEQNTLMLNEFKRQNGVTDGDDELEIHVAMKEEESSIDED